MSVANGTLRQVKRLLLPLLLAGVMVLLAASGWLWRLDNLLYDLQLGWRGSVAADDIMLVAVDDQSLAEFGRWPWPRERHAQLIEILTRAGARAIVMDLLFAEPDPANPQGDRRLIQAVAASGKVFMPVVVEELQLGGQLLESLPLPQLTEVVAGLGHVHMELDDDGIARGIYLQEGLGEAFWPHLMLTVLQSLEPARFPPAEQSGPATTAAKRFSIVRQGHRLIPFAGPPGHFPRLSYAQVLRGVFHPDSLRDRIVLVGVTATGLGDVLPTPLSGRGQPMAGIEINANILQSLRNGEAVKPLAHHWQLLLTGLLVALPLLLYSRLPPRLVPLLALGLILSLLLLSLMVLQFGGIWFAPSAALLGLVLSYPLWSWRRLEQMVLHLD
jgi:CHASE2 domain-containing sensor protein